MVSNDLTDPYHDALLGGYAYRGNGVLQDMFVFGLYGTSQPPNLLAISTATPNGIPTLVLTSQVGMNWPPGTFHGVGQDSDGDLYVIRVDAPLNETLNNGRIYKIVQ